MRLPLFCILSVIPLILCSQGVKKDIGYFETGQFSKVRQSELRDVTRVITESEIRLRGANNLKDILIMENGGIFNYDKLYGWQFQWHGSSKGNFLILLDGLPFRSSQFEENDLQQIPVDNISRIEIIENPSGVVYGNSAIMMVVNIISKSNQLKVYKPSLRFQAYHPGSFFTNLNMGRRTTENYFRFSSCIDAYGGMQGNDSGRVLQWLPYTRVTNQLYYSHKVLQYMDVFVGFNNLYEQKTHLGYPYPQTVRAYDREIRTNNNTLYAGLKGTLTRDYSVQGDVQLMDYSRRNTLYLKDISTAEQLAVNDTSLKDTVHYNYVFTRWLLTRQKKNSPFRYLAGFDFAATFDQYKTTVNHVRQSNATTSLFARITYTPLNSLVLDAGLRLPYSARYKTRPLWEFGLLYKFTRQTGFKLLVSRNTKAPTFDQLYATYLTNGYSIRRNLNLTDESVLSLHYSLIYRDNAWTIEPGFFYFMFKKGIELVPDRNSSRLVHRNISEKKTIGTRLNISCRKTYFDIDLRMIITGNNLLANIYDNQLFFEEIFSNLTLKIPRYGVKLCYVNKMTSERGFIALDAVEGSKTYFIGRYYLADAVIEKSFGKKPLVLRAGVKNIFNVRNVNSYYLPVDVTGNTEPTFINTPLLSGASYFFEINLNL